MQSRWKSPLFWAGLVAAVYEAVVGVGVAAGVAMPWWIGAIGVGLATVVAYATGNNPSIKNQY